MWLKTSNGGGVSPGPAPNQLILGRFSMRGVMLRLFFTCWLVYALHFATNTVRELYPVLSLGDHLSVDVSDYSGLHPDIFVIPGRGAFINNNPGASFMGAVPYAIARPLIDLIVERIQRDRAATHQPAPQYKTIYPMAQEFYQEAYTRGFDVKFGFAAGVTQAFLMAPLSALSVLVMFRMLLSLIKSARASLFLSLLYAFATPIFYRTAQLNQNLLISDFALFAFALLYRPWDDPLYPRRPVYLAAGLLTGWTLVLDYSGIVVVAALSLYAIARRFSLPAKEKRPQDLYSFGAGILACVAILMGYQWIAFGNPLFPAQHYMPPTPYSVYGFNGMGFPQLDLFWDTAFGLHFGLFMFAPLLLLGLYVPAWFDPRIRIVGARETWFILLFTLALFLFASANQYGRLQFNSGVRYVVPATPLLFLLAAGALLHLPKGLAVGLGIITTYWSWCLSMYRDVEQGLGVLEPIIHITREGIRLPWLSTLENLGYVASSLLAPFLVLISAIIIWILWNSRTPSLPTIPRITVETHERA